MSEATAASAATASAPPRSTIDLFAWQRAASLSARVHKDQYRKDGHTPYAAHPTRVALVVACVFGVTDPAVIAAALLHDAIEDCGVDYDELEKAFGNQVAGLVAVMSKDMRLPHGERERAYDAQLAAGPWQGRLLKLADVYDNMCDSRTESSRRKMVGRVQRALAMAGDDPELHEPCRIVRELLERVEVELNAG